MVELIHEWINVIKLMFCSQRETKWRQHLAVDCLELQCIASFRLGELWYSLKQISFFWTFFMDIYQKM